MSLVVCGIHPSVNVAYRAKAQQLNVSQTRHNPTVLAQVIRDKLRISEFVKSKYKAIQKLGNWL